MTDAPGASGGETAENTRKGKSRQNQQRSRGERAMSDVARGVHKLGPPG
jgi:hypothetical protein